MKDLQTSITYYRERLGFQLDFQGPDDGPFWAGWGFAITDADSYVLTFFQLRDEKSRVDAIAS